MARLLPLMDAGQRLRWLRRGSFVHQLVGKHEQQAQRGGGFTGWPKDRGLLFEYEVPARICSSGSMPLSAILSIVDETTTWASIGVDKDRRPGVSLVLEASLTDEGRPPVAGDRLVFESSVQKLGRTIGFQSCDVLDAASGRTVCTARHIKMLDMGIAWRWLMRDPLFQGTSAALLAFGSRPSSRNVAPHVALDDAEAFEELLAPTRPPEISVDDSRTRASARLAFDVREEHLQETGLLFGGVHAMLHEASGTLAAQHLLADARCVKLRVNYMASGGLGDALEAHVASTLAWRGAGATAASQLMLASGARGLRSEALLELVGR